MSLFRGFRQEATTFRHSLTAIQLKSIKTGLLNNTYAWIGEFEFCQNCQKVVSAMEIAAMRMKSAKLRNRLCATLAPSPSDCRTPPRAVFRLGPIQFRTLALALPICSLKLCQFFSPRSRLHTAREILWRPADSSARCSTSSWWNGRLSDETRVLFCPDRTPLSSLPEGCPYPGRKNDRNEPVQVAQLSRDGSKIEGEQVFQAGASGSYHGFLFLGKLQRCRLTK